MDVDKKIELYVDLWKAENPIKTNKLMLYLIAQPLLALGMSSGTTSHSCYFFSSLGIAFSVWWFFCVGRTIGYQKLWKHKIEEIADVQFFPSKDEKKNLLPWYGTMPSSLVVLGPTVAGAVIWLIVLVFICGRKAI